MTSHIHVRREPLSDLQTLTTQAHSCERRIHTSSTRVTTTHDTTWAPTCDVNRAQSVAQGRYHLVHQRMSSGSPSPPRRPCRLSSRPWKLWIPRPRKIIQMPPYRTAYAYRDQNPRFHPVYTQSAKAQKRKEHGHTTRQPHNHTC